MSLTTELLPFEEAIRAMRSRVPELPDVYYGERVGVARATAFSVAWLASMDQIRGVLDSLTQAMEKGEDFRAWKKRVQGGEVKLEMPDHRLDNIFRTNIQGAYSRGRCLQHAEVRESHPYLRYSAVNDSRTRPAHARMHGHIARWDDPIWAVWKPENGYRCRCSVTPITESRARRLGIPSSAPDVMPDKGWAYDPCAADQAVQIETKARERVTKGGDAAAKRALEKAERARAAKAEIERLRIMAEEKAKAEARKKAAEEAARKAAAEAARKKAEEAAKKKAEEAAKKKAEEAAKKKAEEAKKKKGPIKVTTREEATAAGRAVIFEIMNEKHEFKSIDGSNKKFDITISDAFRMAMEHKVDPVDVAIAFQSQLLSRLRAQVETSGLTRTDPANVKENQLLKRAAQKFPDTWTIYCGTIDVHISGSRGHYDRNNGRIISDESSTFEHEYAHFLQDKVPGLDKFFQDAYNDRTLGKPLVQIPYAPEGERYRDGGFYHPYQGKDYGGTTGAAEMMTMSYEPLLGECVEGISGTSGRDTAAMLIKFLAIDPELASMAVGLLFFWRPGK